MAKKMQTLKLSESTIKDLKSTAKKRKLPFNYYCEQVLINHPFVDERINSK